MKASPAILVAAWLLSMPGAALGHSAAAPQSDALKAAFIFNFAKFTEWPALPAGAPIAVCVVGGDVIATALDEIVRGQNIDGHPLEVLPVRGGASWRPCHVLYVPAGETRRSQAALADLKALPVLTVSDEMGFARSLGIVELYVEDGRMRFAINVTAVEQSGLRVSSRLLGLARIVRVKHVP